MTNLNVRLHYLVNGDPQVWASPSTDTVKRTAVMVDYLDRYGVGGANVEPLYSYWPRRVGDHSVFEHPWDAVTGVSWDSTDWPREARPYDPYDDPGRERDGQMNDADDVAMDRWARRYDELNGAPENDEDR